MNGRGFVTTDPTVLDACPVEGRTPRAAIGVAVAEAFVHCAKALRRGGLWEPASWPDAAALPSAACMLRDHLRIDVDEAVVADALEEGYCATLWEPGGDR